MLFLTFGDKILSGLGLSRESTAIAGGIGPVRDRYAPDLPASGGSARRPADGEPLLVPLATPAWPGPGAGRAADPAQYL